MVDYWGILGLLATVFILVYSFRQSRVSDLRGGVDELMLRLHHEFNVMHLTASTASQASGPEQRMSAAGCMAALRVIDRKSGKPFNGAYLVLRRDLESRTVAASAAADPVRRNRNSSCVAMR